MKYVLILILTSGCVIVSRATLNDKLTLERVTEVRLRDTLIDENLHKQNLSRFKKELGELKKENNLFKFRKTALMLINDDNSIDTVFTDGKLFLYKGQYYLSKKDLVAENFGIVLFPPTSPPQ